MSLCQFSKYLLAIHCKKANNEHTKVTWDALPGPPSIPFLTLNNLDLFNYIIDERVETNSTSFRIFMNRALRLVLLICTKPQSSSHRYDTYLNISR